MNIALWVAQILLAAMFIMAGTMKAFAYEKAKASIPWVKETSRGFVRFIGIAELLGGIGLILPVAFNITPSLTGIAGLGFALIMLLAVIFHVRRNENKVIGMNVIIMLIAIFVVIGRL
jgi:uncharacterized membrane protein YphA (DoxX/SURF4 family)